MATYETSSIDKGFMECPYNSGHKVPANRMPYHLIKCQKNSNVVLMVCPFNACHRLPRDQFQEHLIRCNDRKNVINPEPDFTLEPIPKARKRADPLPTGLKPEDNDIRPQSESKVKQEKEPEENWD